MNREPSSELIGSNFNNFSASEFETLTNYLERIDSPQIPPEIRLYNWCRFARWQDITKLLVYERIFQKILQVQGDIVQFGVHNGQTLFAFAHLSEIFEPRNYVRRIWGVDTYDSRPISEDKVLETHDYNALLSDVELFNSSRYQAHIKKIHLIKGAAIDGCDLLRERKLGLVSALLVYLGNYEEERYVLKSMWKRLSVGGVVLFGSLNSSDTPGCTDAFMDLPEFLGHAPQRFEFATKYSYIIKTSKHG